MLRHPGVFGDMGAVDRSKEELAVLRKFPDPVVAQFRRGGDLAGVVNVIKANRFVEVRAAVGAGKSTQIPLMLSKAMGCLVIHTVPFSIAAQYLADYLMSNDVDGDKFVYMDDLRSDMPRHGVVLMSTPFFHARRAYDAFAGVDNAILYLDESHESDGWTASLRTLAPAMKSFRCVVKATATANPGSQLTVDSRCAVKRLTYPRVDVSTWSANDRGVPWAATEIQANIMMCIDRKSTRRNLAAQYADYGFTVRDCSDEDYAYFRETIRMLKDPTQGIVVVLVDYKYRSSFSIPSTHVFVDSCEVAVPSVEHGMPKVLYRAAYDFEVQQFLGRGARMDVSAVLYRSAEQSRKLMCDLESLECDAANLLYRMMGFRPPLELVEYPFFRGKVPIDIAAAMASAHPLRLCPDESRVPWVNGHQALVAEKQKAAYEYDMNTSRKGRVVSCHTIADVERAVTPPPEVPRRYRSTVVDIDGLDEYRSSRASSPSAVFTLDTDVYDNLSAAQDASAVPPKRIAKRVLEARAAEAAALERERAQAAEVCDNAFVAAPLPDVSAPVVKCIGAEVRSVMRHDTVMTKRSPDAIASSFGVVPDSVQPMYTALREREKVGPDIIQGRYYHYHGMDTAPEFSMTFIRGLESIVKFCEDHSARRYVKGLTSPDKMYAMRTLVDASNKSTAVAMGMQRLFAEVSGRPPDQWQSVVDHKAMLNEIEWMLAKCSEEQAKVKIFQGIIPLFADYDLEPIPAPLELEQRVMVSVMERFERVAVKRDPDKMQDYWQRLNGRNILIGSRDFVFDI